MQEMPESKYVTDKGQQGDALLVAGCSEYGAWQGCTAKMSVQVGLSCEAAALKLGVDLLSGAKSEALGSGDKCQ